MSDTSLVFNVHGRDRGANALLTRTASTVRAANMAAAASAAAAGVAMAGAAAQAIALGSAVLGAAGALGLLPAAAASATAWILAARAATMGLGDAWKATGQATAGGGGSAAATAARVAAAHRQVEAATQALADAQRDALDAQQAVTRARQEEAERLEDLSRALAGARLDEEAAARAVTRAERELALARRSGRIDDIQEADLAYRRALHTLEEVRARVEDLTAEQEDAARKGIEGSDRVQAALRRQADAQRAVEQAAQRLADAQDAVRQASAGAAGGGINPAAQALARLAPSARAVILTLRSLVPAWEGAARAGQQETWRGVAGDLRDLSSIYLPRATSWLTRMSTSFNTAIRESLGLAQTRGTVRDVSIVLDATARASDRVAQAVRPIINGLMQWAAVGASFLPGFAGEVGTIAQRFERWSVAARESGRMQEWISRAVTVLRQLGSIALDVGASVLAIFRAGDDGGATLDGLVRGAAAMRAWLESAEGQERVGQILTTLRQIVSGVGDALQVVSGHADTFGDSLSVAGVVAGFAADHLDTLAKLLPVLAAGYVISRGAQTAANVASVVALPIRLMEVAASWAMSRALRAHTTALMQNTAATRIASINTAASTAATTAADTATKRSVVGLAAQRVAMLAGAAATGIATAATWALNAAMTVLTSPVTLIILAVLAIAAGLYLLWTRSETFRAIVTSAFNVVWGVIQSVWEWVRGNWPLLLAILTGPIGIAVLVITRNWDRIKAGAAAVRDWIVDRFTSLIGFITGLPGRISRAAGGLFNGVKEAFRNALNWIIARWNGFSLTLGGGRILGVNIPSITLHTPNLPMLADGGTVTRAGLAVVGERGPEVVSLSAGASVVPLPRGSTGAGSPGGGTIRVIVVGGDRDAVDYFRRLQAEYGF